MDFLEGMSICEKFNIGWECAFIAMCFIAGVFARKYLKYKVQYNLLLKERRQNG